MEFTKKELKDLSNLLFLLRIGDKVTEKGRIILVRLEDKINKNLKTSHNSRKNQSAKSKVIILDNNPLSIASYMEEHPDVEL